MATDIHEYQEKKVNGVWVTTDTWVIDEDYEGEDNSKEVQASRNIDVGRDYDLFGLLAGVRREVEGGFEPKGLPDDVCPEVKADYESWGSGAFTPSWLTLKELKEKSMELLLLDNCDDRWIRDSLSDLINQMIPDMPAEDVRIVFWFDC